MTQEAYCSYEVSKLLKEKGFNESTRFVWYEHLPSSTAVHNSEIGKPKRDYFYWEKERERNSLWTNDFPVPSYISGEVYSCPTHQMAMAWLREVHGIFIAINNDDLDFNWQCYDLINRGSTLDPKILSESYAGYKTYEKAVEAALKYSLENLL